jgi:hypothetical protein
MGGDYWFGTKLTWPSPVGGAGAKSLPVAQPSLSGAILHHMKVEEIAEAVAKLPVLRTPALGPLTLQNSP